jgi:hypothetical protein
VGGLNQGPWITQGKVQCTHLAGPACQQTGARTGLRSGPQADAARKEGFRNGGEWGVKNKEEENITPQQMKLTSVGIIAYLLPGFFLCITPPAPKKSTKII